MTTLILLFCFANCSPRISSFGSRRSSNLLLHCWLYGELCFDKWLQRIFLQNITLQNTRIDSTLNSILHSFQSVCANLKKSKTLVKCDPALCFFCFPHCSPRFFILWEQEVKKLTHTLLIALCKLCTCFDKHCRTLFCTVDCMVRSKLCTCFDKHCRTLFCKVLQSIEINCKAVLSRTQG